MGTLSALARESRVTNDGEIDPFSILDSIPVEMPAATPSSATVRSRSLRSLRTSAPIADSSERVTLVGACEPVRRSNPDARRRRAGTFSLAFPFAMVTCFSPQRLRYRIPEAGISQLKSQHFRGVSPQPTSHSSRRFVRWRVSWHEKLFPQD